MRKQNKSLYKTCISLTVYTYIYMYITKLQLTAIKGILKQQVFFFNKNSTKKENPGYKLLKHFLEAIYNKNKIQNTFSHLFSLLLDIISRVLFMRYFLDSICKSLASLKRKNISLPVYNTLLAPPESKGI